MFFFPLKRDIPALFPLWDELLRITGIASHFCPAQAPPLGSPLPPVDRGEDLEAADALAPWPALWHTEAKDVKSRRHSLWGTPQRFQDTQASPGNTEEGRSGDWGALTPHLRASQLCSSCKRISLSEPHFPHFRTKTLIPTSVGLCEA